MTSQSNLIPFGKYKDQPIEVLRNDPGYVSWLSNQSWLVERYPQIHTLIINNLAEPSETPEHNAMQVRFLDDSFTNSLWDLLRPVCYYTDGPTFERNMEHFYHIEEHYDELPTYRFKAPPASDIECIFERDAIDVIMIVKYEYQSMVITPVVGDYILPNGEIVPYNLSIMTKEIRETLGNVEDYSGGWKLLRACPQQNSYAKIRWVTLSRSEQLSIELKPSLGDDYPAVLRQVNSIAPSHRNSYHGRKLLIFNTFTATGATLPQVAEIFRRSGITLIPMSVIEQASDNHYIVI